MHLHSANDNTDNDELHPRHKLWLRRRTAKLHRLMTGRVDCFLDDNEPGRASCMLLIALGLPDDDAEVIAGHWATPQVLNAITEAAERLTLRRKNVARVIGQNMGLTYVDWKKHKAWFAKPYDKTDEELARLAADQRNANKRKQRAAKRAAKAAQIAVFMLHPREDAIREIVDGLFQQRRGAVPITASDIRASIARAPSVRRRFQLKDDATLLRVIRRVLDRLEDEGFVRTWTGPRQERCISPVGKLPEPVEVVPTAALPLSVEKPWECDRVSRRTWFRRRQKGRGTDPDTRTAGVPPVFPPQTFDDASVSTTKATARDMARHKVKRTTEEATSSHAIAVPLSEHQSLRLDPKDSTTALEDTCHTVGLAGDPQAVPTLPGAIEPRSSEAQQEPEMRLSKEEREAAMLELRYMRQRITALERQLCGDDDEKQPGDHIEPHKTVQ